MILVRSRYRSIPKKDIERDIAFVLDQLGYTNFSVTVVLTTNELVAEYNKKFRHKEGPTNILSFPYFVRDPEKKIDEVDKEFGDIIIAIPYVRAEAQKLGLPFNEWLRKLIIHGMCHLAGYDHETDTDYQKMSQQEDSLYRQLTTRSRQVR